METLALVIFSLTGYWLMYRIYGRFISKKIFALSESNKVPSVEFEDGVDYVPTRKEIIFGHHFTSIAGTGPIVGPAIAIIWGWLPAILWVFIGSAVMGAVHDFGSLIISMRNQGKSISEFTSKYINARTRVFFFIIVFLAIWIVIAVFGLVIAIIFHMYPTSVLAVWLQIPIAIYLGHLIYKKGKNIGLWSIVAVVAMYFTIVLGSYFPLDMPSIFGIPATGIWTIILLIYAYIASVLPVTTLLQPRDFINCCSCRDWYGLHEGWPDFIWIPGLVNSLCHMDCGSWIGFENWCICYRGCQYDVNYRYSTKYWYCDNGCICSIICRNNIRYSYENSALCG
ncbi:MAG: carbon starvation CstA family protein [Calditrichaceae bacterium]